MSLEIALLWLAGVIQLIIAAANFVVAKRLDYRENLRRMSPIAGQVFIVHAAYIVFVILCFALLCLAFASRLVTGDPMMRAILGTLALFWAARVVIHLAVYDKRVRAQYRMEDIAFLAACSALAIIFTGVALR